MRDKVPGVCVPRSRQSTRVLLPLGAAAEIQVAAVTFFRPVSTTARAHTCISRRFESACVRACVRAWLCACTSERDERACLRSCRRAIISYYPWRTRAIDIHAGATRMTRSSPTSERLAGSGAGRVNYVVEPARRRRGFRLDWDRSVFLQKANAPGAKRMSPSGGARFNWLPSSAVFLLAECQKPRPEGRLQRNLAKRMPSASERMIVLRCIFLHFFFVRENGDAESARCWRFIANKKNFAFLEIFISRCYGNSRGGNLLISFLSLR